jgi:hypothetical protein
MFPCAWDISDLHTHTMVALGHLVLQKVGTCDLSVIILHSILPGCWTVQYTRANRISRQSLLSVIVLIFDLLLMLP